MGEGRRPSPMRRAGRASARSAASTRSVEQSRPSLTYFWSGAKSTRASVFLVHLFGFLDDGGFELGREQLIALEGEGEVAAALRGGT